MREKTLELLKNKKFTQLKLLLNDASPVDVAALLSEMEKDKALERYLKKINNRMEVKDQIDKPTEKSITFGKVFHPRPVKPEPVKEIEQVSMAKIIVLAVLSVFALMTAPDYIIRRR